MIEGVYTLLDKLKRKDRFYCITNKSKKKKEIMLFKWPIDIDFEIIHENYIGEDKNSFKKKIEIK